MQHDHAFQHALQLSHAILSVDAVLQAHQFDVQDDLRISFSIAVDGGRARQLDNSAIDLQLQQSIQSVVRNITQKPSDVRVLSSTAANTSNLLGYAGHADIYATMVCTPWVDPQARVSLLNDAVLYRSVMSMLLCCRQTH
jgi:hypothetical protein